MWSGAGQDTAIDEAADAFPFGAEVVVGDHVGPGGTGSAEVEFVEVDGAVDRRCFGEVVRGVAPDLAGQQVERGVQEAVELDGGILASEGTKVDAFAEGGGRMRDECSTGGRWR